MTNQPASKPSPWSGRTVINSVTAGYIAGVTGTIVGHPIDSLKVWMQTGKRGLHKTAVSTSSAQPTSKGPQGSSYPTGTGMKVTSQRVTAAAAATPTGATTSTTSVRQISTLVVAAPTNVQKAASTMRALYAGVSGPLVTVGLVQSINFAVFDSTRRFLHHHDTGSVTGYLQHDSLSNVAAASMTAGAVLALFTNPLLLVKTKQQTSAQQLSYGQAVSQTVNWRGHTSVRQAIRNLYTGFAPHCVSEIGGRAVYFVSYEFLKRQLAARRDTTNASYGVSNGQRNSGKNTVADRMIAASVSGIICWSIIFPLDAIRCRMYATNTASALQMAKGMYQSGWRSFYRGFGVTLLRAGPVAAFVLPIYDAALAKLSATT